MAWLAIDEDGTYGVYKNKPYRVVNPTMGNYWNCDEESFMIDVEAVEIILGRELTWEDEPVEIKEV